MSSKKDGTAVPNCNPALSVLVVLVSRKVTFSRGHGGVYQSEWKLTTTKILVSIIFFKDVEIFPFVIATICQKNHSLRLFILAESLLRHC